MEMTDLLEHLAAGGLLSSEQTRAVVGAMVEGRCAEAQSAAFLTALRVRGETTEELVGVAQALRERVAVGSIGLRNLLDTCGTGGDNLHTFNISTATAIVASACGVAVAKHGNRSVSSKSGSADVLAALGLNIEADPAIVLHCLKSVGLAFFFAPRWHSAMKNVMGVRRALRFRTIFNLAGPLANPVGAEFQLVGVGSQHWAHRLAEALQRLGSRSAIVVHGEGGLDEVSLSGSTLAVRVTPDSVTTHTWTADDFGLPASGPEDWKVESADQSAATIRGVLSGARGPARDVILANTAAALLAAGAQTDLQSGVDAAAAAIDSGEARRQLERLVELCRRPIAAGEGV